jgi:hypothetical protein
MDGHDLNNKKETPGYGVSHGLFDAQFARDTSLKSLGMQRGGFDPDFVQVFTRIPIKLTL